MKSIPIRCESIKFHFAGSWNFAFTRRCESRKTLIKGPSHAPFTSITRYQGKLLPFPHFRQLRLTHLLRRYNIYSQKSGLKALVQNVLLDYERNDHVSLLRLYFHEKCKIIYKIGKSFLKLTIFIYCS